MTAIAKMTGFNRLFIRTLPFTVAGLARLLPNLAVVWNRQIPVNDGPIRTTRRRIALAQCLCHLIRARYATRTGQGRCGLPIVITLVRGTRSQGEASKEQQNGKYDFHGLYLGNKTEWTCPAGP